MRRPFPFYPQLEEADCGPACLKMIFESYGKNIDLLEIKNECPLDRSGTTLRGLSMAAETFGFRTNGVKVPVEGNEDEGGLMDVNLPCIAFWKQRHYVVVYRVEKDAVWTADPAFGKRKYSRKEFEKGFLIDTKGVALLLEPTPAFDAREETSDDRRRFSYLFKYLKQYRGLIGQVIIGLAVTSAFSMTLPFLTQMVVDKGIVNQDIGLVYMVLIGQMIIFTASAAISFLQSWIFLHIGSRINISMVHDFLVKLMQLPIPFFNRRTVSDLLKRVDDHQRVNSFITSSSLNAIFSIINIVIFSIVLMLYSGTLFATYWFFSLLYLGWIFLFLKKRKELDYKSFEMASANQSKLLEIINGIQEIRLQGSEKKRRWQWVNIQAKAFRLNIRSMMVTQFQGTGALFINQLKNILISFIAAMSVINGEISLGMMLAVQFIIGSINSPLESIIGFVQSGQNALISFDRLNEINHHADEEPDRLEKQGEVPADGNILLENLSFRYAIDQNLAIENVNLEIERNKITAIVGSSGSGKTTIIKLLLGFYKPTEGAIKIGGRNLNAIRLERWRAMCGAVMQDQFVFPDTIAHNICESDDFVNKEKLYAAAKAANVDEFVSSLAAGYNTAIGEHGISLSKGQFQRVFIARAIYKDPEFIFFDEATNALDSNNEKLIMNNLNRFYSGRTVIIVAHRLSTIVNADRIVVLNRGQVVEQGSHKELFQQQGHYYRLVTTQLEINE